MTMTRRRAAGNAGTLGWLFLGSGICNRCLSGRVSVEGGIGARCLWCGKLQEADLAEARLRVLAVKAEGSGQIRPLGVGEVREQAPVGRHRDLVTDLDDPHGVRDAAG